ncbi:LTA synthase family protein [Weissella hellenica]|uniref:LTA synthase family protein n=1 Tax=Weissella hellenica TaxID=46256 RepID=A0A4Y4G4T4_WEIHE|nr:LTA synthase family protein [Weissella hellenica]NKY67758.1 LTA synthase family protein [Weissella hellenica]GED36817.1 alkaline phosphatase [Weissella hellenica]SCC14773.1 lipoteichoic acid synthase [Weissella hellenica]
MAHKSRFSWINTRFSFFVLLVVLVWGKTQLANIMDFHLYSGASIIQFITLLLNPIPLAMLLIGIAFYFKKSKLFYPIAIIMYIINILLVHLNVIYYREFTDFMSVATMLGYDKVDQGLGASGFALTNIHDLLYWIDIPIFIIFFLFKKVHFDKTSTSTFLGFSVSTLAIFGFMTTLVLGEADRPQLITRQFDSKMLVKYLGIDAYTVFDGVKTRGVTEMRKSAKKSDIDNVLDYVNKNYTDANAKYAGVSKGKNVFTIHLESFQQFSLDLKVNNQEVTPNLNDIYHSDSTIAFDNFFHQVGQGKTSDAENMLETSTFGLPQGSLFATQGNDQTFQAMPSILKQNGGYSSAVFHGNNASFWNRNNVYKNMGYQYFFDASYYDTSGDKAMGYGLKDKLLFYDSVPYLEKMQQPFYAKYITVTNHFPYSLDAEDKDPNFVTTDTDSDVVNGYFETNHYLDQSIGEFYNYLKKSGLYDNSIIVLYGDHYGISNSENKELASVLGKNPNEWTDYDNAQLQRVPFMINIPGWHGGGINHTYGGEIDVMPTLLHLLGVDSKKYVQLGQDLLSSKRSQVVAFRDKDFVTPEYTYTNHELYDNKTGEVITNPSQEVQDKVDKYKKEVREKLKISDNLNQKDLLRFYKPKGYQSVDASKYNYANGLAKLKTLDEQRGDESTSLWHKRHDKKSQSLYETDAPEKDKPKSDTSRIQQVNPDGGDDTDGGNDTPNP